MDPARITASDRETAPVGPAVALGYFYNFVRPLNNFIEQGGDVVRIHQIEKKKIVELLGITPGSQLPDDPKAAELLQQIGDTTVEIPRILRDFRSQNVFLYILYPTSLRSEDKAACSAFLDRCSEAAIRLPGQRRPYGLNYLPSENQDEIRLVDYARPIQSAPDHYREIGAMHHAGAELALHEELEAFLAVLVRQITQLGSPFQNRIYFVPMDEKRLDRILEGQLSFEDLL